MDIASPLKRLPPVIISRNRTGIRTGGINQVVPGCTPFIVSGLLLIVFGPISGCSSQPAQPPNPPQFVTVAGIPYEELPRLQRLLARHGIVSQQGDISGRGGTPIQVKSTQRETARRLLSEDAHRRRYHIALPQSSTSHARIRDPVLKEASLHQKSVSAAAIGKREVMLRDTVTSRAFARRQPSAW